jgi:hypothetical protein
MWAVSRLRCSDARAGAISRLRGREQKRLLKFIPVKQPIPALPSSLGALVRRSPSGFSSNPFVRPLYAAFIAGVVAAVAATGMYEPFATALVAFCPCMVLVLGPHLLNGAMADVIAAGCAVASFSMPWRMLPFPIAVGMLGHAGR